MATFEHVLYEKQRGGVLISLNRPETLNALSEDLQRDLNAALREFIQTRDGPFRPEPFGPYSKE